MVFLQLTMLLVIAFWLCQINIVHGLNVHYTYFKALYGPDVASVQPVLRVVSMTSHMTCHWMCGADDACEGYNYSTADERCELLAEQCLPGTEVPRSGNVYMENLDKRFCHDQSVCFIYGVGTWAEAYAVCPLLHPAATMIQETSAEEGLKHHVVATAAGYDSYWLSGRRPVGGGRYEFYWLPSGNAITYARWRAGQPYRGSTIPEPDCILAKGHASWKWDDAMCSRKRMYMCKFSI